MAYQTEQERFWAESFGSEYRKRNALHPGALSTNLSFFSKALSVSGPAASACELGCNIGLNLHALQLLAPDAALTGLEINPDAVAEARATLPRAEIIQESILEWSPGNRTFDLAFTKGVLIHIHPDHLPRVYDLLARLASRCVLIAEYYSPNPVTIPYRGHEDRLFKRDFAGEFLDRHPEFALADYGFLWRRDPVFPQDDLTWFLLRRQSP